MARLFGRDTRRASRGKLVTPTSRLLAPRWREVGSAQPPSPALALTHWACRRRCMHTAGWRGRDAGCSAALRGGLASGVARTGRQATASGLSAHVPLAHALSAQSLRRAPSRRPSCRSPCALDRRLPLLPSMRSLPTRCPCRPGPSTCPQSQSGSSPWISCGVTATPRAGPRGGECHGGCCHCTRAASARALTTCSTTRPN